MEIGAKRNERRTDALSKERIVDAAIAILDAEGEAGLSFRALAARLVTGSGAIYHHVADKGALLGAATDQIIAQAMVNVVKDAGPRATIRSIAVEILDAIAAHSWLGNQLSSEPAQSAMLQIFEAIGGQIFALGVPENAQFNAWSVLVNYILGTAVQDAANARRLPTKPDRAALLGGIAARWTRLDPVKYPFLRQVAAELAGHDDREQFLAGIDLILDGIDAKGLGRAM